MLSFALQQGFIADHGGWRKIVLARNKTSHSYDEEIAIDDLTLLYRVDCLHYESLTNDTLRVHIDWVGQLLYP